MEWWLIFMMLGYSALVDYCFRQLKRSAEETAKQVRELASQVQQLERALSDIEKREGRMEGALERIEHACWYAKDVLQTNEASLEGIAASLGANGTSGHGPWGATT
jgi:chromosome segregation ATPase